jgi:two-component system, NtrC family, response regulator HydG
MARPVLIVDDEKDMGALLQRALTRAGHEAIAVTSANEALDLVSQKDFEVVLTDLGMAEMNGLHVCERVLGMQPQVPVIVVTGQSTMSSAVASLRAGAFDFITKPVDVKLLELTVERAISHRLLLEEVKRLRTANPDSVTSDLIGDSPKMRALKSMIARIGPRDASVLVHGETGTGKELIARAIHDASPRKDGPFVAINCAAVPLTLIEAELFGHAKGAFTDAKGQRKGIFLEANGGTLFLDEIGELPLETQPKLLRALQQRVVRPLGSETEVPFDVRLVCATNRDLEYEVYKKTFREDLFYRVNVVTLDVPSLRDRPGDVLLLATHFLKRAAQSRGTTPQAISARAAEKLVAYQWPGNVRELENCIERAVAMARFEELQVDDLPEKIRQWKDNRLVVAAGDASEIVTLEQVEKNYIERALTLMGGNMARTAQVLGLDRRTLYRKLARWQQKPPRQAAAEAAAAEARASAPVAPPPAPPPGQPATDGSRPQ